ncbi:MAG: universal stress protein [Planctomycetaceae bacterium]|nr:universal stress protein [Planctomycetaceae bacterium]
MLPRFQHVLVPLDFSGKNHSALEAAFEMAKVNSAKVTLLHVIERLDEAVEVPETASFYDRLQQRADAELERHAQRFVESNIPVDYKVRLGKRVVEIVRYIGDHNVDLVVLSSHPINPEQPGKSLSTISYQVSVLSPCPVLLMK